MSSTAVFKNIANRILKELDKAQFSICIAVAWITNKKLLRKLIEKANDGCKIELIFVDDEINQRSNTEFELLTTYKAKLYKIPEVEKELMHNKFCIIDNNTVITGSYNWSYKAERNFENIQITHNERALVNEYNKEFRKISNTLKPKKVYISKSQINYLQKIKTLNQKITNATFIRNSLEEDIFNFSKSFLLELYEPIMAIFNSEHLKGVQQENRNVSVKTLSDLNGLIQPVASIKLNKTNHEYSWDYIKRKSPTELKFCFVNLENLLTSLEWFNNIKNDPQINFIFNKNESLKYIDNIKSILKSINSEEEFKELFDSKTDKIFI